MALTQLQRKVAKSLFISRPAVLPGTRVIVDDAARKEWFANVTMRMEQNRVNTPEDVNEFCDIAGVPD